MSSTLEQKWTPEMLASDDVSKKDIALFIQENGAPKVSCY